MPSILCKDMGCPPFIMCFLFTFIYTFKKKKKKGLQLLPLYHTNIQECHHVEQLKQSTKGTEEWDKEFHPSLFLSVTASSYGPDKRGRKIFVIYV